MQRPSGPLSIAGTALGIVLALAIATPAAALPPDQVGVYPGWSVSGASGAFSGAPSFPASADFPATTVTSTATSVTTPAGATNFFNAASGFGAEFGTSRNQPYLLISTAAGQAPSTTTVTFAEEPPAGWGFALGDIDADWVFVQAYADDDRTIPLSIDQLGFEAAGNSCLGSPRPSACSGAGLPFESPVWVTATETFDGTVYQPPTLRGALSSADVSSLDTAGAYGWFRPTVPVRSVDFLFGRRSGFPTYTLTFAAPAPKVTITGTVDIADPGTSIALQNLDGIPILDMEGMPVTVPVLPDGSYSIETEQRESYLLDPVPPPGFEDPPAFRVAADTATVTVPPIVIGVIPDAPSPEPTATPAPTTPAPETPPAATAPSAAPALAESGAESHPAAGVGVGLLLAGATAILLGRFRRRAARR